MRSRPEYHPGKFSQIWDKMKVIEKARKISLINAGRHQESLTAWNAHPTAIPEIMEWWWYTASLNICFHQRGSAENSAPADDQRKQSCTLTPSNNSMNAEHTAYFHWRYRRQIVRCFGGFCHRELHQSERGFCQVNIFTSEASMDFFEIMPALILHHKFWVTAMDVSTLPVTRRLSRLEKSGMVCGNVRNEWQTSCSMRWSTFDLQTGYWKAAITTFWMKQSEHLSRRWAIVPANQGLVHCQRNAYFLEFNHITLPLWSG